VTAAIALVFKAIVIPTVLHRIVQRLGIHREIETVGGVGLTMLAGMALVALSMVIMLRVTPEGRPAGARGSRLRTRGRPAWAFDDGDAPQAVSQVVGFMSLENGLVLAGTGAKGMPLVVEISIAFSILNRLHRDRHFPVPHPRALRHRRCPGARPLPRRTAMRLAFDPEIAVLVIPLAAAALLAALPGYRATARINVLASLATLSRSAVAVLRRAASPGKLPARR